MKLRLNNCFTVAKPENVEAVFQLKQGLLILLFSSTILPNPKLFLNLL